MTYASAKHPFPGLRPFEYEDRAFFFGRSQQVDTLHAKLLRNRFIAIVGSSGSGKSSLVKAGLMAELVPDRDPQVATWRPVVMRPLGQPLAQLAAALTSSDAGAAVDLAPTLAASRAKARLTRSSAGLAELLREASATGGARIVLIVDQFEELFRYPVDGAGVEFDERDLFVKNLLAAAQARDLHAHVLITMRSEFIGDCARFRDLPEAVSDSQFLTPNLTREQRRETIMGPLRLAGGDIEPSLLQRLLNDVGQEADQLPVLQHALMRAWETAAKPGYLQTSDYEQVGGMKSALSLHAEGLLQERPDLDGSRQPRTKPEKRDIESIFRALTDLDRDGRATRRPTRFAKLAALCATTESAAALIDAFRDEDHAFLSPKRETPLTDATIVDITHEALIRKWTSLTEWVKQEAEDGQNILRLSDLAVRREQDPEFTLGVRETAERTRWWRASDRSAAWSRRYLGDDAESKLEGIRHLLEASAERAARDEASHRQAQEAQIEIERLLRERAEKETQDKERELQLEQLARKTQRQKYVAQSSVDLTQTRSRIFLSYARSDKESAFEVKSWLIEQGFEDVFFDTEIDTGAQFANLIVEQIETADILFALLSNSFLASKWSQAELHRARELGKPIISLILERGDWLSLDSRQANAVFWNESGGREKLRATLARLGFVEDFFPYVDGRSPYPGLSAFEAADAAVFFGRSGQIKEVLNLLNANRQKGGAHVLTILGASGSGKTSFLRAGLWPRIQRDPNLFYVPIFSPGALGGGTNNLLLNALHSAVAIRPEMGDALKEIVRLERTSDEVQIEAVEMLLIQVADHLKADGDEPVSVVFAIDQAEELLRAGREQRLDFLSRCVAHLIDRNGAALTLILSLRSGDYEDLQKHSVLGRYAGNVYALWPIPVTSFRTIIEGPALVANIQLEPQLTDDMLADIGVGNVADSLPLVAFVLRELYERYGRQSRRLEKAHYEAMGLGNLSPLESAVRRRAEETIHGASEAELVALRAAFTSGLVRFDEEHGAFLRRDARLGDLPIEAHRLLDQLVDGRLLVKRAEADGVHVEVAHESLFHVWPQLAAWLDADRDMFINLQGMRRAASEWEASGRTEGWLTHRGFRLAEAEAAAHRGDVAQRLSPTEWAYLEAARAREESEAARRQRNARYKRTGVIVLLVLLGLTAVLAGMAGFYWQIAERQALVAEEQTIKAKVELARAEEQKNLAELESRRALLASLRLGSVNSPSGKWSALLDSDGKVRVLDLVSGEIRATLALPDRITAVVFSPNGYMLATAGAKVIAIWEARSWSQTRMLVGHENEVRVIAFSPDGQRLASGSEDDTARIWDVSTGKEIVVIRAKDAVTGLAFSPDGARLLISLLDGSTTPVDAASGAVLK